MGALEQLPTIFSEAVKAGSFGTDVTKFVSFKSNKQRGIDHFCSNVLFGDVTLELRTGHRIIEPVFIKTRRIPEPKHKVDFNVLFHNEVLFYSKIMPSMRRYDKDGFLAACLCEFVYGKATDGQHTKEDVVILKSLNPTGFRFFEEKFYLDENHIKLILDRLARFHALSLAYQMDDPEGFNQLVLQIQEIGFHNAIGGAVSQEMFANILQWGVNPLRDDPEYRDRLPDLCVNLEHAMELWKKYIMPSDTLNVLCHGDFQRNNMMFKYGINGDPIEVVFFDFQLIKICSPAIDVSMILSLNVAREVRHSHWDEFLRIYYDTMARQLSSYPKKPSFETVEMDLRRKGIYGYYVTALLGPKLLHVQATKSSNADLTHLSQEEIKKPQQGHAVDIQEMGGTRVTEMLFGVVKHMLDKSYIF